MKYYMTIALLGCLTVLSAQKKILDHADFDIWNSIENEVIAADGRFVMYDLERGEADHFLKIHNTDGDLIFSYDRAEQGAFTYDSKYAIFKIKAWKDSVLAMKRRKVKKDKMPKDSLGIYHLTSGKLEKIAGIKSVKIPEEWSGYLAYQIEAAPKEDQKKDTSENKTKEKKVGKKNGYHLLLRNIATAEKDTFKFVTDYVFAKKGKMLAFTSTGEDKEANAGVYVLEVGTGALKAVHQAKKAKYSQLTL
ncbi:MAG: hypothetical protein KJO94_06115, partial [Eudoraea sp.]|nr:hypothetical protein [Eudoraea sp.]